MRSPLLSVVILLLLCTFTAQATIIVNLDQATLAGAPGQTITFTGKLENTSSVEQFIGNYTLNTDPALVGNSLPFLINGFSILTLDFSLLPGGGTTASVALFDIEIPFFALPGTYSIGNEFQLFGGPNLGDQNPFPATAFTVVVEDPTAVPEPGTWLLLSAGLGALAVGRRRRS